MRSNKLKQGHRWSKQRYTIKRVEGDLGEMPRYDLADDGKATMQPRYSHDQLILANDSEPVPADIGGAFCDTLGQGVTTCHKAGRERMIGPVSPVRVMYAGWWGTMRCIHHHSPPASSSLGGGRGGHLP